MLRRTNPLKVVRQLILPGAVAEDIANGAKMQTQSEGANDEGGREGKITQSIDISRMLTEVYGTLV